MRALWTCVVAVSQVVSLITALRPPKTIHLPPGSPDGLLLGCYEGKRNDPDIYELNQTLNAYRCIQACAREMFPLAAVFNISECQCANNNAFAFIKNHPCASPDDGVRILDMYNATDFLTERAEVYQQLTFALTSFKVTPTSSTVTPSRMTVNGSRSLKYSVDFGDGTHNITYSERSTHNHRFLTHGLFTIRVITSQGNVTLFRTSRTVRVLSRLRVGGMSCSAVAPGRSSSCVLNDFFGSGITVLLNINRTRSIKTRVPVPDVPRSVLGCSDLTVASQLDSKLATSGIYLLSSLQFTVNTIIEAWEIYAENPGQIQLHIYRATWNFTRCRPTCQYKQNCGKWDQQSDAPCDDACVEVTHCYRKLSCGHAKTNYTRVYHMDVNVTSGYNLIILPEHPWFEAYAGDIGGFESNTSVTVVQTSPANSTQGTHFVPGSNSEFEVDLDKAILQNTSFKIRVRGITRVTAKVVVSCLNVGVYPLIAAFTNALQPETEDGGLKLQSSIFVQNPIGSIVYDKDFYIAVNTTKSITVNITHGTNISCKWNNPTTGLTSTLSTNLELGNETEGGICAFSFSYHRIGHFSVSFEVSNRVSSSTELILVYVRTVIRGLQVHMCNSLFAFKEALTCFNSSVTRGNEVGCTWYFGPNEYEVGHLGKTIFHKIAQLGVKNLTLFCYNFVSPEPARVSYQVRVIANPLSVEAPLTALANTQVKFTCTLNWTGGSPAAFFATQSVAGMRGANITASPALVIDYNGSEIEINASSPSVYLSFKRLKKIGHKVQCKAKNYPNLNIFRFINIINAITQIRVTHSCPSQVLVGSSCTFQVQVIQGDQPQYRWTIFETEGQVSFESKQIQHRFSSPGVTNITVNVTNEFSSLINTTSIFVLSLPSSLLPSNMNTNHLYRSMSPSAIETNLFQTFSLPSANIPVLRASFVASRSSPKGFTQSAYDRGVVFSSFNSNTRSVDNLTSFGKRKTSFGLVHSTTPTINAPTKTSIYNSIDNFPSLDAARLLHSSSGLVGEPSVFSIVNIQKSHLFSFRWSWGDQTAPEKAESSATHTYDHPGQYSISVHICAPSSQVTLFGHVTVQYPIAGLHVRYVTVGSSNVVQMEFAISHGTNITYLVNYGDDSEKDEGLFRSMPSVVMVTHQFQEPGSYNLSILVSSLVGPNTSIQHPVTITDTPCAIHEVRMLGAGEKRDNSPEIQQEYEYSLYSSLKINCSSYEELKYTWQLENITNNISHLIALSNDASSSSVFFIASSSLRSGLYKFTLTITALPQGISQSTVGYLHVRMPRLQAFIACGSERTMSVAREVVLDASKSRDPNDVQVSNASVSLSFEWFCNEQRNTSCFGGVINNREPMLKFPPNFLESNKSYSFVVVVTHGDRSAEAKQRVLLLPINSPSPCVRCMKNCAQKLATSKEFVLNGGGCQDNKNVTCIWELYGPLSHKITRRSVSRESVLITKHSSAEFVLDPRILIQNETYTIALNSGLGFWTNYTITTDMFPSGGSCSVSPLEGKVIKTRFRITCSGWTDEDSPLWYEFFLKTGSSTGSLLLSYGWLPYSQELFLPSGSEQNDFTLEMFTKVSDVLGSYIEYPLRVKVRSFDPDEGSVGSILKSITIGSDSMLERLLAFGEFQQATQLLTTVVTVLNEDLPQSPALRTSEFRDRVEVRSQVIQSLSQMSFDSSQCIRQTLGALLQATTVTAELLPEALIHGATLYTGMAEALAVKYKNTEARQETEAILHGLTHVVDASLVTIATVRREQESGEIKDWINNDNEARNQNALEKCQEANSKSLEGIDYTAQKILYYQRKGQAPSHVDTNLIRQTLRRQSPADINDAALDGREVSFHLPLEVKRNKLGHLETVDSKVVTTKESLFTPRNAITMNTPVSSLEFQETSGKHFPIRDLLEPISIFFNLNQSESKALHNITGRVTSGKNMTVFKIEPEEQSSLYFTIKCSGIMNLGEQLIFFGRSGDPPTEENFDFRWNLTSCNATTTKLLPFGHVNNSDGLFLGVALEGANKLTNYSTVATYDVNVKAVSCFFWNESLEEWRTSGCKVGPLTTLSRIHCLCNHLTWFGGRLFVAPNKLHLDIIADRILDPATYAPVLALLCTTLGVYVIVVVWARREDRQDILKTGISVSPSNRPGDAHAYEVIICTGMRRHAGTTANVAIAITGERGESHAFLLKNYFRQTLTRGSVDSFLVTTSQTLGQLSYIRVWHDNYGSDPAWYVKQISVRKVDTDEVWHFLCDRWLAVDEGDGMVDRIFTVTSNEELQEFRYLFLTKAYKDLTDSHLWFSVVWRPPQSPFTRVQRVSCCLSLLLCTMMANAMWYEADKGRSTAVQLGPIQFSWEQVSIGICSSLIVFPINLLLVQIFRHCRRRPPHPTSCWCLNPKRKGRFIPSNAVSNAAIQQAKVPCADFPLSSSKHNMSSHISLRSAVRSVHLPSLSVSLATSVSNNSTNDLRFLLQRHSDSRDLSEDSEMDDLYKEMTKNKKGLPWWFVYVGWSFVVLTSLTAACVTLLYGIEFGRTKSTQWLLSMLCSVTQDVFVSQPLKVVFLAVIFAYIFKKPDTVISSSALRITFQKESLPRNLSSPDNDLTERPVAPPVKVLSEEAVMRARDKAAKERAMHAILLDLGTFVMFLFLVLLIAYGFRDKNAFHQSDAVAKVLLNQNFTGLPKGFKPDQYFEIIRRSHVWDWIENVLLPALYNLPWYFYTGKPPQFIEGESGLVVGVARFRQHRVQTGFCKVVSLASDEFSHCVGKYSIASEDQQSYAVGWAQENMSTTAKKSSLSPDPWRYSSSSELHTYPYTGGIRTYSGGGYVIELSHIYYKALRQVHDARFLLWADRYTRSVFIEFTLYNPNSNLFCAVTLLMETMATGGVFPRAEFLSYRLQRYVGDFQFFILACEFLFLVFVLYFTYREAKKVFKTRRKYFTDVWNLLDLTVLVLCWVSVAYYFICLGLRTWTTKLYRADPTKFVSFQYLSTWQLMFEAVLGVMVFVTCLKFIKLLRFNRRIFLLSYTLKQASDELLQYAFVFGINFMAFSQLYYFLLASEYRYFSTLLGTMQKLLNVLLGKFSLEEMMTAHRILGAVIFFLYMAITNFIFFNVLIAIVIESFKVAKQKNDRMQNEFELLEFVMARLKDFLGMRSLKKPTGPLPAYTNEPALYVETGEIGSYVQTSAKKTETAVKLERSLDRLERYIDQLYDREAEDDILCCYVSRRIQARSSKRNMTDYTL